MMPLLLLIHYEVLNARALNIKTLI